MTFIGGGVRRLTTKKALREAVKADASAVVFFTTDMFGATFNGPVSDLPNGITLTVVGPDPYRDRRWYASISRRADGSITVK